MRVNKCKVGCDCAICSAHKIMTGALGFLTIVGEFHKGKRRVFWRVKVMHSGKIMICDYVKKSHAQFHAKKSGSKVYRVTVRPKGSSR